jgi:hypothetical protein
MRSIIGPNHTSRLLMVGSVLALIAMTAWGIGAQGRGPDLLGLYPGMPAAEAFKVLQAHSSVARVTQSTMRDQFSLSIDVEGYADTITVLTTDPASPAVVWHINRTLYYSGKPMAKSTMLDALRQKYGKEAAMEQRVNTTLVWWLFDREGRLVPSNLRMVKECHALGGTDLVRRGPLQGSSADVQACYSSYIVVYASMLERAPDILDHVDVTFFSLPIGYQASLAVRKTQQSEAEKKRQEELERARQNKPKF